MVQPLRKSVILGIPLAVNASSELKSKDSIFVNQFTKHSLFTTDKCEIIQMSMHRLTQTVVCTYNELSVSLKEEWYSATWYNIDELWKSYVCNVTQTQKMCSYLHEVSRAIQFIDSERRSHLPEAVGRQEKVSISWVQSCSLGWWACPGDGQLM